MKRLALGLLWMFGILAWTGTQTRGLHGLAGYLVHTGPHLLAAAAALLAAWGVGTHIRRALVPDVGGNDAATRAVLALALGLAGLQTAAVLLGSVGLLTRGGAMALTAGGLLAAGGALRDRPVAFRGVPGGGSLVLAAALLLPTLLLAGAPPTGPDEGQYHRRFVEHLLATGSFPGDAQDPLSALAMGLHAMLALPASWTGVGAARPFCLGIGLAALVAGHRVTRRLVPAQWLWMYAPIALGSATLLRALPTLNTDVTLGLWVTVGAIVVLDWRQAPEDAGGRPWALAVLGGAALSVKYTAPLFFAPLYAVVAVALLARPPGPERGRTLVRLSAAALVPALFAVPWMVRNGLQLGHPLAPFLGFDPPPGLEAAFRFNFSENYGGGESLGALLRSPLDLFALGREFDRRHFLGRLNVWPLVAAPGLLLALRRPGGGRALVGAVGLGFLAWSLSLRRVIYLLPLWPLLAATTVLGLQVLLDGLGRSKAALAGLAALLAAVAAVEAAPGWLAGVEAVDVATGRQSRADYLLEQSAHAAPLDYVRRHADDDATVAMVWAWQAWDLPQRVVWIGAEEHTPFRELVLRAGDADGLLSVLRAEGVGWIIYRTARFPRAGYPSLSEEVWTQAFQRPLDIVDATLNQHAVERWTRGEYRVYELPADD